MAFAKNDALALLRRAQANGRLAHAYLITGGEEAREVALALAGMLLGGEGDVLKHPDLHRAEPESKSRRIVIEQIREIEHQLQMRAQLGGMKVGIIFDADRLQEQAANAFLKTLEEPPRNSHLLLVSTQPEQLLETILSRCIEIAIRPEQRRELTPRQVRLLEMLRDFAKQPGADLARTLGLAGEFRALLAEAKEVVAGETGAALKAEEKHYKQASDVGHDWLEAREEYYKALTESRYRGERAALVEIIEQWWADILRQQHGGENLDHPKFSADTGAVARRLATPAVLSRAAAIVGLRENFGRNVQEQLAIEVAFLESFAA